jgi:hypothetical protein
MPTDVAFGSIRRFRDIRSTSGSLSTPDMRLKVRHGSEGPCVDGSELARDFFTSAGLVGAAMCSAYECGSHDRWP